MSDSTKISVWDPFVRTAHWMVALGFFVAYFTEDEALTVNVWAGYVVGVLVLLRIIWGFVGPRMPGLPTLPTAQAGGTGA